MEKISIQKIEGFKIGQAQDTKAATGCTVIICEKGAVCGVDVRGGSPSTRDTDALNPVNNRSYIHAVLLSGGSAFGLDAAGGVMRFLEEKNIGRSVGVTTIPNVCAAVLFDLKCGSHKIRPDEPMGYAACLNAFSKAEWKSGNYGAGIGSTIGKTCGIHRAMKSGIGSCAFRHGELYAGAVVAVNCVGDVIDNRSGKILAGTRNSEDNGFAGSETVTLEKYQNHMDLFSENTIIGCIITNARLSKAQATKLATLSHNGIARTVRPSHMVFDGDTLFTMCFGGVDATLDAVGILACSAVEHAIVDAVESASSFDEYPSVKDYRKKLVNQGENQGETI